MTLTTARLMAAAVDADDLLDRLMQERDATADRYTCGICGLPDPSGSGECLPCFQANEEQYERSQGH